ncbi:hypothetical protein INT47_001061 [Mucor saturninus]|uniref:DOC domain-containing protein n=1 Tax=Mucor saturninus TaxID=64648 RepID=A0A8H7QTR2_9FUNG|nr:hypothetical protein INT47_001061 [Mucor saturninus]
MSDLDESFEADYNPPSSVFSSPPHEYEAYAAVSGFGESDVNSLEGSETEEAGADDAQLEKTAKTIYLTQHPGIAQRELGGREIGKNEAIWRVSSFRSDWGPENLRDNNPWTYWQSNCPDPRKNHTIDVIFHQATLIRQVSLFLDFFQDESYTPRTICIRCGTSRRDLLDLMTIECEQDFVGWLNADVMSKNDGEPFRLWFLQIAILNTHSNGRDTHIRQIKVFAS